MTVTKRVVYAAALLAGGWMCLVAAVPPNGRTPVPARAAALVVGLALILGSEPMARSRYGGAYVPLLCAVAVPFLPVIFATFSMAAAEQLYDLGGRAPLRAISMLGVLAALVLGGLLAGKLAVRWARWRLGASTGLEVDADGPSDGFNEWIFVATMYLIVLAGLGVYWLQVIRLPWNP